MTIEEKAKAYDEALEKSKRLYEQGTITESLAYIFPELKESEDEKIRKALISFLKSPFVNENITDEHVAPWIAWLEKQEQILANSCKSCKDEQKPFDYENATVIQKDFAPKADMPRYSIGDVLCDKSCTMLNKESQSNFEITDIRNGMYICDKCSFPISQQDEYELVAKRIEQKPAWSEEDNKHYESCLNYFEEIKPDAVFYKDYLWFKSLKERIEKQ